MARGFLSRGFLSGGLCLGGFCLGVLCPDTGHFAPFFPPGAGVRHHKPVPKAGILMEKISSPVVSPGGNRSN